MGAIGMPTLPNPDLFFSDQAGQSKYLEDYQWQV